ncbi:hypothetical protein ACFL4J_01095 [Candidatus Margulisiibacteriota bacterium]
MTLKKSIIAVAIILAATAAYAGVPHTSYGVVSGGLVGDNWHFYLVSTPSSSQDGTLKEQSGSIIYQVTVGNIDWADGDDSLIYISRETNTGMNDHTGYYAVMNEDLDVLEYGQLYNDCTVRSIPVPTATAGTSNVGLSWSDAMSDPSATPHGNNIVGYNVYRSTSQSSGFTKINTSVVNNTTYTDTSGTAGTDYYYTIEPVMRGGEALGVYSANSTVVTYPIADGNITLNLTYNSSTGNLFWIALPYLNSFTTASDVVAKINADHALPADSGDKITQIGRWDGATQLYETYDYLGFLGWSGTDFPLVKGEAIFVNIAADVNATLPGSHDPAFAFNIAHNISIGNIFWISLPKNGSFSDAVEVVADINANASLPLDSGALVTQIGYWNSSTQAYETYDYLGFLGWSGTNFSYVPSEGYFINIVDDVSAWSPSTL